MKKSYSYVKIEVDTATGHFLNGIKKIEVPIWIYGQWLVYIKIQKTRIKIHSLWLLENDEHGRLQHVWAFYPKLLHVWALKCKM